MARKPFTTTIDIKIQENFKKACKDAGVPMNTVLEVFMIDFTAGKFSVEKEFTISLNSQE